jgi:uncharacterized protein YjiS (DUF1127 family)
MTAQDTPYPRVQHLINTFSAWLEHRRELNELRQMDRANLDQIASDLRISANDLEEVVRQGPHAADELPKLLEALGLSEADLAKSNPLLLRDMERVCALCRHKRECDHDLAAGTSAAHYKDYCLNASTIEEIQTKAE